MFQMTFAAVLILSAISYAECAMTWEQMNNAGKAFRNVCQPKNGVDTAVLDGMKKGEFPEDPKFQCYLKCVMNLLRTIKNGEVDMNMLLKQVDLMVPEEAKERTKAVVEHCAPLATSPDMCVAAYQFVKCNWDTDSEVFFFP